MTQLPEPRAEMLLMLRMLRLLQVYVEVSLSDLVLGELQIVHMVCVCVCTRIRQTLHALFSTSEVKH